jgi:hypothetical protein
MNALTFPAYVDNVLQPIVDKSDDKDALIDWLNNQSSEAFVRELRDTWSGL